jgi:hypothetical protein
MGSKGRRRIRKKKKDEEEEVAGQLATSLRLR